MLAFSFLLPIHSLAIAASSTLRSHATDQDQDPLSTFLKSLQLFRSVNSLMLPSLTIYTHSTLLPLLQVTTQDIPEALVYPGMASSDLLETVCSIFFPMPTSATTHAQHAQQVDFAIFNTAISLLRTTFAKIERVRGAESSKHFTIGIILIWTIAVSDEYMKLLEQWHACAMAILAHFATLLHAGDDVWWLEGLGAGLVGFISEAMTWPGRVADLV